MVAEVRLRGSWVTPGVSRARSLKRRPFSGSSLMARSSSTLETAAGSVSATGAAPETVTVSRDPATSSANASSTAPPTSTRMP